MIILGDKSGTTDEEDNPRAINAFQTLRARKLVTWVSDKVFEAFMQNRTGPEREEIINALKLRQDPLVQTDLPSSVALHVWQHGNGPMISVQLANVDEHKDSLATKNSTHELTLRIEGTDFAGVQQENDENGKQEISPLQVMFYSWSLPAGNPVELPSSLSTGLLKVKTPPFDRFGAIVIGACAMLLKESLQWFVQFLLSFWIGARGEVQVRAKAGLLRKLHQRLELATTVTPGQMAPTELLSESKAMLETIQGPDSVKFKANSSAGILQRLQNITDMLMVKLQGVKSSYDDFSRKARRDVTIGSAVNSAVVRIDFNGNTSAPPSPPGWHRVGPFTTYRYTAGIGATPGWLNRTGRYVFPGPAPATMAAKGSSGKPKPCPFSSASVRLQLVVYIVAKIIFY